MNTTVLEKKLDYWEKQLLDLGKRNKMINYRESKRATIKLVSPSFNELFTRITSEDELEFQRPISPENDARTFSVMQLMQAFAKPITVQIGDIGVAISYRESLLTLRNLRNKANLAIDEQGISILYMASGFIEWSEGNSGSLFKSPLLLVPVGLSIKSRNDPYVLKRTDDDIVVNPALSFLLKNRYNIDLPEFDPDGDIDFFMSKIEVLATQHGWQVTRELSLGLLSFQKINMYSDLQGNHDRILHSSVLRAIAGDPFALSEQAHAALPDHDSVHPQGCYQVVNADSSQQNAISLSQTGVSFVLQGPPGTGKSQTITNIIAQGLADGKKILFVSEKMAALQVVYRRMKEVNLADFCLQVHSHKINKKEILQELGTMLNMKYHTVNADILRKLGQLDEDRKTLNRYASALHKSIQPLGVSIYQAYGELARLDDCVNLSFTLPNVLEISAATFYTMQTAVNEMASSNARLSLPPKVNPWCNFLKRSMDLFEKETLLRLLIQAKEKVQLFQTYATILKDKYNIDNITWKQLQSLTEIFGLAAQLSPITMDWINKDLIELARLTVQASAEKREFSVYINRAQNMVSDMSCAEKAAEWKEQLTRYLGELRDEGIDTTDYEYKTIIKTQALEKFSIQILEKLRLIQADAEMLSALWNIGSEYTWNQLQWICELVEATLEAQNVQIQWLDVAKRREAAKFLPEAESMSMRYHDVREQITQKWAIGILEIDHIAKFIDLHQKTIKLQTLIGSISLSAEEVFNLAVQALDNISTTQNILDKADRDYGINCTETLSQYEWFCRLADHINRRMYIHPSWLDASRLQHAYNLVGEVSGKTDEIKRIEKEISSSWVFEVMSCNYIQLLYRFTHTHKGLFRSFSPQYATDRKYFHQYYKAGKRLSDQAIIDLLENLKKLNELRQDLRLQQVINQQLLGRHYYGESTDWHQIKNELSYAKKLNQLMNGQTYSPTFITYLANAEREKLVRPSDEMMNAIYDSIEKIKPHDEVRLDAIVELQQYFISTKQASKDIIDAYTNYQSYWAIEGRVTWEQIQSLNELLNEFNLIQSWFQEKHDQLNNTYGALYKSEETEWNIVQNGLEIASQILFIFKSLGIELPHAYRDYISQRQFQALNVLHSTFSREFFIRTISEIAEILPSSKKTSLPEVKLAIQKIVDKSGRAVILSNQINAWLNEEYKDASLAYLLDILIEYAQKQAVITSYSKNLSLKFGMQIDLMHTDWESMGDMIRTYTRFCEATKNAGIADAIARRILLNVHALGNNILLSKEAIDIYSLSRLQSYFTLEKQLEKLPLSQLSSWIDQCIQFKDDLDNWLDYRMCADRCIDSGLETFVEAIEAYLEPISDICGAFQKGFYRMWLRAVVHDEKSIETFMVRAHDDCVKRFAELDEQQLQIAQCRIREKLIRNMPQANQMTLANDEIAILRHELGKKNRIMPLRKLFKSIPNLLLRLKPCLMMSPLSVSYFLEAQTYEFDMVIFDEASQVFPEDAVGAIFRGKQVIIAGDSKQLPPTNFFSSSTSSDDAYDKDEDDQDEIIITDSILEEANNRLNDCPLLWHYRSRSEQLIAFSNHEIYQDRLVTFPGNVARLPHLGVEYIYVSEGVYENRTNSLEAQECVQLVREHIENNKGRSLGIIAFSEAQQSTIEDAILEFRENNPQYDEFFMTDKDEPFFIKNLENVQGDERDTIIFSICYAPTAAQRMLGQDMYMRFGPLGHPGGERRLNVAITRAKFNVKLVGSILPKDIKLQKIKADGVRLLRAYIAFALEGTLNQETHPNFLAEHDLFCDAVSDFIEQNGYQVTRKLGASEYKIDIAVHSKKNPDTYIAGIECDGLMYVLAKTARDRDHLRANVLRSMGWRLHRVWSSYWMRSPTEAKSKLLGFLKEAEENEKEYPKIESNRLNLNTIVSAYAEPVKTAKVELPTYQEAYIGNISASYFSRQKIQDTAITIIKLEQPIHIDILYRRMAPVYGNEKVTNIIRYNVDEILKGLLKRDIIMVDGFVSMQSAPNPIPRKAGDRKIEHISPAEIAAAMKLILDQAYGINEEDLSMAAARLFGFERRGPTIQRVMQEVIEKMLNDGRLRLIDEKIQVAS